MATASIGVRERMAAASRRIARVKLADRAATGVITFGGIFIIVCVLFIFVFIFEEALPLFRGARSQKLGSLALAAAPAGGASAAAPLAVAVDEYQKYLYAVEPDASVALYRVTDASLLKKLPVVGLEGASLTSALRSLAGDVALGTADGRAASVQMRFRPVFEGSTLKDLEADLRVKRVIEVDPQHRPVRDVASEVTAEGELLLAALVGDDEIVLARASDAAEGETPPAPALVVLRTRGGEKASHVRLGRGALVAATEAGQLYHWELSSSEPRLTDVSKVSAVPLTAVEFGLGGNSVIVGDRNGQLSGWFRARAGAEGDLAMVRAHEFEPQGAAIVSIHSSTRERSFVTGGADGSLFVRHLTSERTLLRFPGGGGPIDTVLITPRADGMLVRSGERIDRYSLDNPHPEVSVAGAVRQGLVRGLPRARLRLAVDRRHRRLRAQAEPGAAPVRHAQGRRSTRCCSPFRSRSSARSTPRSSCTRASSARVKPTVEIMAALPSVVLGFLAGLWLAPRVEAHLVPACC